MDSQHDSRFDNYACNYYTEVNPKLAFFFFSFFFFFILEKKNLKLANCLYYKKAWHSAWIPCTHLSQFNKTSAQKEGVNPYNFLPFFDPGQNLLPSTASIDSIEWDFFFF